MRQGTKRCHFDVHTVCEPVLNLLEKGNNSLPKLRKFLKVAPTCSSFDEMLQKLNLMRDNIEPGSADELYKNMLMENRDIFVFQRKMSRQHEVVKPEVVEEFLGFCIIRKPMGVYKMQIEYGIAKLIQDGDLPKGSMLTYKANKATWTSETFLVVGKKENAEENAKIFKAAQEEKEFYVLTEAHEDYDNDDDVYTISKDGIEVQLRIQKKRILCHSAVPGKRFTLYHVWGSSPWSLFREDNLVDIFNHNKFTFTNKEYPTMAKMTDGPVISCCKFKIKPRSYVNELTTIEAEPNIPRGFSSPPARA